MASISPPCAVPSLRDFTPVPSTYQTKAGSLRSVFRAGSVGLQRAHSLCSASAAKGRAVAMILSMREGERS